MKKSNDAGSGKGSGSGKDGESKAESTDPMRSKGEADVAQIEIPSLAEDPPGTTRIPSGANIDVDPGLVVHRFSHLGSDHVASSNEYDNDESEGTRETNDDEYNDYLANTDPFKDSIQEDNSSYNDDYLAGYSEGTADMELDEEEEHTHWDENNTETIQQKSIDEGTVNTETIVTAEVEEKATKKAPTEMGKASFRWFERKILSPQIPPMDENTRRRQLLEKCQMLRRVSKPLLTIMEAKSKMTTHSAESIKTLHQLHKSKTTKLALADGVSISEVEMDEGEGEDEEEGDEEEEGEEEEESPPISVPQYTEKDWAMKNTLNFLSSAGCSTPQTKTVSSRLKSAKEEAREYRFKMHKRMLERRKQALEYTKNAPGIAASYQRHAERAMWRSVIDNTKPRYPLPRFILPRHLYLKKVQREFLGPGSYEHDVYDEMQKLKGLRLPTTWKSCTPRFPREDNDPNKYGACRLLDPWTALDAANYKRRYPGTYIPFESTPKCYRGQALLSNLGARVPPGAYNIKSPLDEYIKKRTSLRGPYDCYTPSRGIIPYGYFMTNKEETSRLGPGSYEIRTSVVKEMKDPYNAFKGQFGKADRDAMFGSKAAFEKPLWPRKGVIVPPPGAYEVGKDVMGADKNQNLAPFMNGAKFEGQLKRELVAPDYYYFATGSTWTEPPKGSNLASAFNSKTPQIMTEKMYLVRKIKNRATNPIYDLEEGDKKVLVHYAPIKSMKNDYALEDCQSPCWKEKGGPVKDPWAIPGHGVGSENAPKCPTKCCGC